MSCQVSKPQTQWPLRILVLILLATAASCPCWAQDTVEYAGASASSAAKASAVGKILKPATTLVATSGSARSSAPGKETFSYLTIPSGPPPDLVNRQALEKTAGKNAAKMLLRSAPTRARVWVNGAFVGTTPLLLIVPPGKYHVKMADDRLDATEQEIGVLPRETREFLLRLIVRYPTSVSIH